MKRLGIGFVGSGFNARFHLQAFQAVRYPILPTIESVPSKDPACLGCVDEILHIRHHSLFVPRDFDVSPYFAIIKPTLASTFDHRQLAWHDMSAAAIT